MQRFKPLKYFVSLILFLNISTKSYSQNNILGATGNTDQLVDPKKKDISEKAPNEHVEYVNGNACSYSVKMNGTLDGFNTVCYPETYSKGNWEDSRFEPNQYVIIENVSKVDVVNPRIVINGRRNWFSADDILSCVIREKMTDAEKAMAIFTFSSSIEVQGHDNNRRVGPFFPDEYYPTNDAAIRYEKENFTRYDRSHPSRNNFKERANPVKAANCYYCSGCQYSASNFVVLCRHAGLTARAVWRCPMDEYTDHCVTEVWYDGDWHLFDPEARSFYLEEDNTTVASYQEIHQNPLLVSRTQGGGFACRRKTGTYAPGYEKYNPPSVMPVEKDWISTLAMTLRPGEKFIWRWDHLGKFRIGDNPRNKGYVPYRLANGKMIYHPNLTDHIFRNGIISELNIKTNYEDVQEGSNVHSDVPGKTSFLIYKVKTAYPIVGGIVGGKFYRKTKNDSCKIYLSIGDSNWIPVWVADKTGKIECHVPIDDMINPRPNPARYEYYVKYEFQTNSSSTDAGIDDVYIESDVQMSSASLPSLSVGENEIVYKDDTKNPHTVRITHGWQESSENNPPLPPVSSLFPINGAGIRLDSLQKLSWEVATDMNQQEIVYYHIQVSPRHDMLYPVSPNFNRITYSKKTEWNLPQGWLIPGKTYFWRVRTKNDWGAWSKWSSIWSFTVR